MRNLLTVCIVLFLCLVGCNSQPSRTPPDVPNEDSSNLPTDSLLVHFINVGQGDSILIDLGETEILIDGGKDGSVVVNYINDLVDGNLEVVVATHPHADHIGGLTAVFQTFYVEQYWSSGDTHTTQTFSKLMAAVQNEGCQVKVVSSGDEITVGALLFKVLNPVNLDGEINETSIVIGLSYGDIDFLFTGDAEQKAETLMLAAGVLSDIDILKVGHHGSHSSSSLPFLNVVKPEIAVYMAGDGNSYGHPHNEILVALTNIGADIYGTDIHGNIIITTDGVVYDIQLEIQAPPVTP